MISSPPPAVPADLAPQEAAALPLTLLTAWHMLVTLARVQAGDSVLVLAAGSGVGQAAIQIARAKGAIVYATAGGPQKVARARELDQFASEHDAQLSFTLRAATIAWSPGYVQQNAARHGFVAGAIPGRMVLPGAQPGTSARTSSRATPALPSGKWKM